MRMARPRPSQAFLATVLVLLAGGDNVIRDSLFLALALCGLHFSVPNCYVGSGPAC